MDSIKKMELAMPNEKTVVFPQPIQVTILCSSNDVILDRVPMEGRGKNSAANTRLSTSDNSGLMELLKVIMEKVNEMPKPVADGQVYNVPTSIRLFFNNCYHTVCSEAIKNFEKVATKDQMNIVAFLKSPNNKGVGCNYLIGAMDGFNEDCDMGMGYPKMTKQVTESISDFLQNMKKPKSDMSWYKNFDDVELESDIPVVYCKFSFKTIKIDTFQHKSVTHINASADKMVLLKTNLCLSENAVFEMASNYYKDHSDKGNASTSDVDINAEGVEDSEVKAEGVEDSLPISEAVAIQQEVEAAVTDMVTDSVVTVKSEFSGNDLVMKSEKSKNKVRAESAPYKKKM